MTKLILICVLSALTVACGGGSSGDSNKFLAAGKPVIINHYNEANCDAVYLEYKTLYNSKKISFICEDVSTEKYKHYNQ